MFELADGGTIFLDEIGEMPVSLQAKMLRILQERQFERIGGSKTFTVDVRIIAATSVSLENEISRGNFRPDLYYRLNVVQILLPPTFGTLHYQQQQALPVTPPQKSAKYNSSPGTSLEVLERNEIEAALRRNGWVKIRAARELGLTQRQIGYRIKKYSLNRYESFRTQI